MPKVKPYPNFYMARPARGQKRKKKIYIKEDLCDICNNENVPVEKLRKYRDHVVCMDCIKDMAKEIK